jgi:dTDP-4-dehydrorhamnose 3,5-epimerase
MEVYRIDEIECDPKMVYVSQTLPGVVRGPHEHRDQTDFFVFMGPGEFELHLWLPRGASPYAHEVHLVGETKPRAVIVPPGIIHAYKCVSDCPGVVFNAPDKLYAGRSKMYPVDEIRYEDDAEWTARLFSI